MAICGFNADLAISFNYYIVGFPASVLDESTRREGNFFFADILSYDFVACNKISKEIRVSNERGIEIVTFFLVEYIYIYIVDQKFRINFIDFFSFFEIRIIRIKVNNDSETSDH